MSGRSNDQNSTVIHDKEKMKQALAALLEALDYAEDTESDRWDFAIPIRRLRKIGLNEADLRWLVRKGWVAHARETTVPGDDGREFRSTGDLTFARRTCFVLIEAGVAKARSIAGIGCPASVTLPNETPVISGDNGNIGQKPVVHWDAEARTLRVNGHIVKRFRWHAANQESVLSAFQEEGWPDRVDDPLPPHPEQDSKRRLSDTIKCLNRKQTNQLIGFHGDGTGEGVVWELVEPDSKENGTE